MKLIYSARFPHSSIVSANGSYHLQAKKKNHPKYNFKNVTFRFDSHNEKCQLGKNNTKLQKLAAQPS